MLKETQNGSFRIFKQPVNHTLEVFHEKKELKCAYEKMTDLFR
jgi:hypothetical protein